MKISVEIEMDTETGQFMVSLKSENPEAEMGALMNGEEAEAQGTPARSLDEALQIAGQLLSQGAPTEVMADEEMAQGFGQRQPAAMSA
jgi:hypothetical protein